MQKIQNMLLKLFAVIILTGIIGCGGGGGGENTPPTSNILPPASGNVIAQAGNEQVIITWDAVADATSYNIYWAIAPVVKKTTGTKIGNVTSPYIHDGRTNGTTYYYVITAVNSAGESPESNEVSATPNPGPPPQP